jgi:hypothetical protein
LSQFINVTFQEQKIKEGLYMMGLKDGIFHLSWFITYALQVTLAIQSIAGFFSLFIFLIFFFKFLHTFRLD